MNAEKLHKILFVVYKEMEESNLATNMQQLVVQLQNMVNQPQQPAYQESVSQTLSELYSGLEVAPSNNFSPAWRQILEEIGLSEYLGNKLTQRLKDIFYQNQITPSTALDEISNVSNTLDNYFSAIANTIDAFEVFKIAYENLEPGECEVGYTIPRIFTKNKLNSLSKEVSEINFILDNISEIILGEKEEFTVRNISSSDYLFYIGVSLTIANVLSLATERIINTYKSILEIKEIRNRLNEIGVPSDNTKEIENYANQKMEVEIKNISSEIIAEHCKGIEKGRKNELTNGLTISLNKIANRIDQGFNLEVRVEPLIVEEDEELSPDEQKKSKLIESIKNTSNTLKFIRTSGKPILRLAEKNKKD